MMQRAQLCLEELETRDAPAPVVIFPDGTEVVILSAQSVVILPPLRPPLSVSAVARRTFSVQRVPTSSFVQLVMPWKPVPFGPLPHPVDWCLLPAYWNDPDCF